MSLTPSPIPDETSQRNVAPSLAAPVADARGMQLLSDWTPADQGTPSQEQTGRLRWDLVCAFAESQDCWRSKPGQADPAKTTLRQVKARIIRSYLRELPRPQRDWQ
jgi:hypothetical protein